MLHVPAAFPTNYLARVFSGLLVLVIGLWWSGAYEDHLKIGVESVRLSLTVKTRVRSDYLKDYRDGGKPSDFIRYLAAADDSGPQGALWPRMPSGVILVVYTIDPSLDQQVLLTADDENQILKVDGWKRQDSEPRYSDEIDFDEVFADRSKYVTDQPSAPPPDREDEYWGDTD